jgi:hypothetical protein
MSSSSREFLEHAQIVIDHPGEDSQMKLKNAWKATLLGLGLAMIGSSAQAGSLTFALDGGIYKNFSVGPALYYSQVLAPNFGVNAYINGKYTFAFPQNWYAGLGVSLNYAIPFARENENFVEGFANTGFSYDISSNQGDPFVAVGTRGSLKFAPNARTFAALTFQLPFDTRYGMLRPNLNGYFGAQVDLIPDLETTAQVDYTYRLNPINPNRTLTFNARAIVFYTVLPDFKIGGFAGYSSFEEWYLTLGVRYTFRI